MFYVNGGITMYLDTYYDINSVQQWIHSGVTSK